jgi:hypothetical protein
MAVVDRAQALCINSPAVIADTEGGETVIINLAAGHYYRLDAESAEVWSRLSSGASPDLLIAGCVNPAELESELDGIVAEFLEFELLRRADGPAVAVEPWEFKGFSLERFTDLEDILGLDPVHEVDPAQGWPHRAP